MDALSGRGHQSEGRLGLYEPGGKLGDPSSPPSTRLPNASAIIGGPDDKCFSSGSRSVDEKHDRFGSSWPISKCLGIDKACNRFEAEIKAGKQPKVEDYLGEVPESDREDLRRELLSIERSYACQSQQNLNPDHPESDGTVGFRNEGPDGPSPGTGVPDQPANIGRYRVEKLLGSGRFGLVYLAHDDELNRPVAIKVPHRRRVSSPEDVETYLAEARMVASLDHAHIVPVYDVGRTEDGLCYVVSKFIEGSDLRKKIQQGRPPYGEVAELVATAAEALHHAHLHGLVHRDIKPSNILLDSGGKPYVADFGMALKEEDFGSGKGCVGSPAYMSPEQARGEGNRVDGRSDIFSLGIVLYELLTGRRPFRGESPVELLEQITTADPRPPRQVDDSIPKPLERICLKALSKRAVDRHTTAKDLADDLRHFLDSVGQVAQTPLRGGEPVIVATKARKPVVIALLVLVVGATLVFSGRSYFSRMSTSVDRAIPPPAGETADVAVSHPNQDTTIQEHRNSVPLEVTRVRIDEEACAWRNVYEERSSGDPAEPRVCGFECGFTKTDGEGLWSDWVSMEDYGNYLQGKTIAIPPSSRKRPTLGSNRLRIVHTALQTTVTSRPVGTALSDLMNSYGKFCYAFLTYLRGFDTVRNFISQVSFIWPLPNQLEELRQRDQVAYQAMLDFRSAFLREKRPLVDVILKNTGTDDLVIHSGSLDVRQITVHYGLDLLPRPTSGPPGSPSTAPAAQVRPPAAAIQVTADYQWSLRIREDRSFVAWYKTNVGKLRTSGVEFDDVFPDEVDNYYDLIPPISVLPGQSARVRIRLRGDLLPSEIRFCFSSDDKYAAKSEWFKLLKIVGDRP